ncbi:MAG: hypothetical protein NDJ89_15190 [Oligoflexia bacterium]|nr:hypothetical protein [Oligoflexia bacterium]
MRKAVKFLFMFAAVSAFALLFVAAYLFSPPLRIWPLLLKPGEPYEDVRLSSLQAPFPVDHARRRLTYRVAKSEGFCLSGPGRGGLNFISIEKPPQGYEVVFERDDPGSGGKVELIE